MSESEIHAIRKELRALREEISKRPTTSDVRVLVLLAILANQLIPALNLAPHSIQTGVAVGVVWAGSKLAGLFL